MFTFMRYWAAFIEMNGAPPLKLEQIFFFYCIYNDIHVPSAM